MADDTNKLDEVEAVYYPQQVPRSTETLTFLGFVFDKIYFPSVYMPPAERLDEAGLRAEIERLKALSRKNIDDVQLINCMIFAGIANGFWPTTRKFYPRTDGELC